MPTNGTQRTPEERAAARARLAAYGYLSTQGHQSADAAATHAAEGQQQQRGPNAVYGVHFASPGAEFANYYYLDNAVQKQQRSMQADAAEARRLTMNERGIPRDTRPSFGPAPAELASSLNIQNDVAWMQPMVPVDLATAAGAPVEHIKRIGASGPMSRDMVDAVAPSVLLVNSWLHAYGLCVELKGCDNEGGGNCFFIPVCVKLGLPRDVHVELREKAVKYAMKPVEVSGGVMVPWIVAVYGEVAVINWLSFYEQRGVSDLEAWAAMMLEPGCFADEMVIRAVADMLDMCVVSFYESSKQGALGKIDVVNYKSDDAAQRTLLLCCQNAGHFFQLWHDDPTIDRQIAEQAPALQQALLQKETAPTVALEDPAIVWMTHCSELEARCSELEARNTELEARNTELEGQLQHAKFDLKELQEELDLEIFRYQEEQRYNLNNAVRYQARIEDLEQELKEANAALVAQASPTVPVVHNAPAATTRGAQQPSLLTQYMDDVARKKSSSVPALQAAVAPKRPVAMPNKRPDAMPNKLPVAEAEKSLQSAMQAVARRFHTANGNVGSEDQAEDDWYSDDEVEDAAAGAPATGVGNPVKGIPTASDNAPQVSDNAPQVSDNAPQVSDNAPQVVQEFVAPPAANNADAAPPPLPQNVGQKLLAAGAAAGAAVVHRVGAALGGPPPPAPPPPAPNWTPAQKSANKPAEAPANTPAKPPDNRLNTPKVPERSWGEEILARSGGKDKDRSAAFAHLLNEQKPEPPAASNETPAAKPQHVHGMEHAQAKALNQSSSDEAGSGVANKEWEDRDDLL